MPTIEETIDLNDIAQHEHEQWLRQSEREERWEARGHSRAAAHQDRVGRLPQGHGRDHGRARCRVWERLQVRRRRRRRLARMVTLTVTKDINTRASATALRSRPFNIIMIELGMEVEDTRHLGVVAAPHAVASGSSSRMMAAWFAAPSMRFVNTNPHWSQPSSQWFERASRINSLKGAFFFALYQTFCLTVFAAGAGASEIVRTRIIRTRTLWITFWF